MTPSQEPIVYLFQLKSIKPGWRTCCQTHTTSLKSVPSMELALDPLVNTVRCSQRDHVRPINPNLWAINTCNQKVSHYNDTVTDFVLSHFVSFTAPPEAPRVWRYISWTGKWLYVWWDHIQYDWFGNISFPLYYKVGVESFGKLCYYLFSLIFFFSLS